MTTEDKDKQASLIVQVKIQDRNSIEHRWSPLWKTGWSSKLGRSRDHHSLVNLEPKPPTSALNKLNKLKPFQNHFISSIWATTSEFRIESPSFTRSHPTAHLSFEFFCLHVPPDLTWPPFGHRTWQVTSPNGSKWDLQTSRPRHA